MKRPWPLFALAVVLAALVAGLVAIFRLRLAQGDVFPAYSSLRADPLGTRVLHDALARVPGLAVERRFRPLAKLEAGPARTIVLAGVTAASFRRCAAEDFAAMDAAVRAGARLVVAFRAEHWREAKPARPAPAARAARHEPNDTPPRDRPGDPDYAGGEDDEDTGRRKAPPVDLQEQWGVDVVLDRALEEGGAVLEGTGELARRVPWSSDLALRPRDGEGWSVICRRGAEGVMTERPHGAGTIVLAGDAFFLSNEALQRDRSTPLLAWIVGPQARVVFDEAHLGVVADTGLAALGRRYGLAPAFFMFLLLAALWVWRRMALFVPPPTEAGEVALAYHPAAGLEALLRRAVAPGELAAACLAEWRRTARPGEVARAEAAVAAAPRNSPAAQHNAALRALRRR